MNRTSPFRPFRGSLVTASIAAVAVAGATTAALGVPQTVQSIETPRCDVLPNLLVVDELGLPPLFPPGEQIEAFATFTEFAACPMSDLPNVPNARVRMTNLNPFAFTDVFYVADPRDAAGIGGTSISNEDGLVNLGQAFRIDRLGVNRPLVFESQLNDQIFAPGETWEFVIDDYQNSLGIPPWAFQSIGVGIVSAGPPSSGSIIGLIPEPSMLALGLTAGIPLLRLRRRTHTR